MSWGLGSSSRRSSEVSESSSSMISLQRSMHSSQMYTPGPAMSFLTCFWLFPQNEHLRRSPPSPNFATSSPPGVFPVLDASRSAHTGRYTDCGELTIRDHLVDDAVFLRFVRTHDEVAVGIARHLLDGLARVVRQDLVERFPHACDLFGLNLNVDSLALGATVWLVDQHP